MEKMSFAFELSEEQKKKKETLVQQLMKNPHVLAWLKKHQKDEQFVYDHSGRFQDWCKRKEACENCKGLDFCRQDQKGVLLDLYLDGMLMNQLTYCDYYKQREASYAHRKYFVQQDMLEHYLLIDIADIDLTKESLEYKHAYAKVIKILKNGVHEKGAYLWGKPGAGKSWLAAGMCNFYAKQKHRVAFVNVPKLISELKMLFHEPDVMEQRLRKISNADVVVFDDIGGESVTAWSRDDILLPLLDARMEKHRLTIFTSNYSMEELKQRLCNTSSKSSEPVAAERLLERIRALSCEIFIKGETRRK